VTAEARLKPYAMPVIAGALSAVLYSTVALMPLFLVPIQFSGARKGHRAMVASSASSAVVIAIWQFALLARAGVVSVGTLAIGVLAPIAMIVALAGMASPRLGRLSFAPRALLGAAAASALSLPSIFAAIKEPSVRAMFIEAFEKTGDAIGAAGLDPELLWTALKTGVASSYGAVMFLFLFLSAWMGSRLGAGRKAVDVPAVEAPEADAGRGIASPPSSLSSYKVPDYLVWALLASWAGLLANRFFPSLVLSAVALNAALALSICYGVQGIAVAGALAERVGLAPALRFLGPIALILLLASGVAGLIAVGFLALLGTLETWIPFRAVTKGDTP